MSMTETLMTLTLATIAISAALTLEGAAISAKAAIDGADILRKSIVISPLRTEPRPHCSLTNSYASCVYESSAEPAIFYSRQEGE